MGVVPLRSPHNVCAETCAPLPFVPRHRFLQFSPARAFTFTQDFANKGQVVMALTPPVTKVGKGGSSHGRWICVSLQPQVGGTLRRPAASPCRPHDHSMRRTRHAADTACGGALLRLQPPVLS